MTDKQTESKDYDYIFKIVLIGDTSVGKSCLLTRFADDQFSGSYVTTIGVDFRFKTMIVKDKIVKVQVWDTAGQERYRSITNAYYRGAEAIIIVFDRESKESFLRIQDWMNEIEKYTNDYVEILVVANKDDLAQKNVTDEDILEFEKKKDIKIRCISAKSGNGVEEAFKYLVEQLINAKKFNKLTPDKKDLVIKKDSELRPKKTCC